MTAYAQSMSERFLPVHPTLVERAALRLATATQRLVAHRMQRRAHRLEQAVAQRTIAIDRQRREDELLRTAALSLGPRLH